MLERERAMSDIWEIRKQFTDLLAKRDLHDKATLELMSHRDVRDIDDKLWEVCDAKADLHDKLCEVVTRLRAKYPNTGILIHPWNRKEFNMYHTERAKP